MQDKNYQKFAKRRRPRKDHFLNEDIRTSKVRLITVDASTEMSLEAGIERAKAEGLDLVQIARNEDISVVKIVDYGKYKFEESKKKKEHKKSQKIVQLKEVKIGPKIDVDDFNRKCREAQMFLEKGFNVRVSMRFRGREIAHSNIGKEKMLDFFEEVKKISIMEREPTLQGRQMGMSLRPRSKKEGGHKKPLIKNTITDQNNKPLTKNITIDQNNKPLTKNITIDQNNKPLTKNITTDQNNKPLTKNAVTDQNNT